MIEFSRVVFVTDKYRSEGVCAGSVGYIIEVYGNNKFEVEVSDKSTGITIAQIVVSGSEIELSEIESCEK